MFDCVPMPKTSAPVADSAPLVPPVSAVIDLRGRGLGVTKDPASESEEERAANQPTTTPAPAPRPATINYFMEVTNDA